MSRARLARLALPALASACNVGPRYVPPSVFAPAAFKEAARAAYEGAPPGAWRPAEPQDGALKGTWWRMFGEPELDALEEQLDRGNQNIAQSLQGFMAARAQVSVARAGYYPTVAVSPSYSTSGTGAGGGAVVTPRAGTPAGGAGYSGGASTGVGPNGGASTVGSFGSGSYFSIPIEASWAPDLWDRVRNTVRQYSYAAQVSAADLENVRLTQHAALAVYYFELRGQDALQDLYRRTLAADRASLELTRAQAEVGTGTPEAVAQAEVTLANAEATATGIATNRALYEHAIATLIGRPASEFSMPVRALRTPVPAIPVGIPSELLQRRPDIAAAERTLAEANALIGVGKAAYYPSLDLVASGGVASSALSTLFSLPALFWSLGASATETIFDGGLRDATVAQYVALYKADVAAYRLTVLTAFQQVEDEVSTMRVLSQQIARQETAVQAAHRFLDIATAQYQTGLVPYLDVITAQNLLLADEQTLVTLRVAQMTAAVQLVQALGGGWDAAQLPAASEITSDEALRRVSGPRPAP
ncbi:MAG TPA: efflux transporter outer membrane subunit [Polyangiaceae bacterium]|nr:efflux transporter outer membrane subunit [Polyangiaceae bacterium]